MIQTTTPTPITPIASASLEFREGNSDKLYQAAIEPKGDGFIVTFAFGRRGSMLNTGTKTAVPVSLAEATKVFDKLVASKLAKGYQSGGNGATIYQLTGDEGRDSGIRCQLLNPVEESELPRLLGDSQHCLQEKYDGRRLLVRKQGNEITGINRRGLVIALPEPIRQAVASIPLDVLIDGEAVGDTLHVFDLLELNGTDLRGDAYRDRHAALVTLIDGDYSALRVVAAVIGPADKAKTYQSLRGNNREGVVFKDLDAPFSPGRPNSGGPQLKFKFVESASFVVTGRNARRSVSLGLYSGDGEGNADTLVPAGNVTIPVNHESPQMGTVIDVKFLYALRQSGSIYQPVYIGPRTDIPAAECTTDQLKYKAEAQAAA